MNNTTTKKLTPVYLYFIVLILTAVGLGLSDQIFGNYFKDAYQIDAMQRGLIEFPRELPGILCIVFISLLSFLGDIRVSLIAQIMSMVGMVALGLFTPSFNVMLIFLFVNSMGMHLFFPLIDSIGLSLITGENVGKRMGQFKAISTAFSMFTSMLVFVGFRFGFFSFTTQVKWIFLISGICFGGVALLFYKMQSIVQTPIKQNRRLKLLFRKEYKFYYLLAIMNGVQKQIMYVYGPWVIIDILGKKADTIALLGIIGAFLGMFFLQYVGKWLDKFGIKAMLFADALSFIIVYLAYGLMVAGFNMGIFAMAGLPVFVILVIFVLDKLSMQFAMVRTIYLGSIAFDSSEVTQTLSLGISMDHVVSIICAYLGGIVWVSWGAQYIFFLAAALSVVNLVVAMMVKIKKSGT